MYMHVHVHEYTIGFQPEHDISHLYSVQYMHGICDVQYIICTLICVTLYCMVFLLDGSRRNTTTSLTKTLADCDIHLY